MPIKDGKRVTPNGERITIEFLIDEPSFQPHHMPFIKNLGTLGIDATLRIVDPVQMQQARATTSISTSRSSASASRRRRAIRCAPTFRSQAADDQGLAEPRRHRRSGDRRADRQDHRGRDRADADRPPAGRSTA